MKKIFFLLFFVTFYFAQGQHNEQLKFSETSFSFGTIQEIDGPVTHEFTFTNNGSEPLQITNVKASCGCTTPDWSKEPVQPGESGFIQAQYNPRNRPGRFNKSLTVNHNLGNPIRLYISGEVSPRPRSITESYPKEMGALRMKTSTLNMGRVYINREPTKRSFEIVNQSDSLVTFTGKVVSANYIKITFDTDTLMPKGTTKLTVAYDGALKDDLGFMNDQVSFFVNEGSSESEKRLTIYATIEEYFPPMTQEKLEMAPRLSFDEKIYDLGRIKPNEKATA